MKKGKEGALVVCSGGLDSSVALAYAKTKYARVEALSFRYGQNHAKRENAAARKVCAALGVPLTFVDLPFIGRHFKSSLLGGKVPDGHYAAANMKSTVVPFRNGIMLAVAAGFAESRGLGRVLIGNHGGDHFIYPDCRPMFIQSIAEAVWYGTGGRVRVESPFCDLTKADIVEVGARLGVPFGLTYSCYKGGAKHCGTCGTCTERREAFRLAGVEDPTAYAKKKGGAR